jgi:polyhydroxyalkanoate synthesis regulator phasin
MAKHNGENPYAGRQLTRLVRDSANQVWGVGRGAYSRVGVESERFFGGLLSIGGRIDREAKSRVFEARNTATEAWDRLESAIEHRIARALNSMQIPTARDVQELNHRVEALQKAVTALERRLAAKAPAPKAASAARRGPAGAGRKPSRRAPKKASSRSRSAPDR